LLEGKDLYIEKMPENCHRIPFLQAIAVSTGACIKIIFVQRNALDVAKSIAAFKIEEDWFGIEGAKWGAIKRKAL